MTVFEFIGGLFLASLLFPALLSYISEKIDKRRKEETIQSHVDKHDYLWLLENCGYSDSNIKVFSYGSIPYECHLNAKQMLMELKDISLAKRFEIAYYHKIIYYIQYSKIKGDVDVFNVPAKTREDLAFKYLVFFFFEKKETANPDEYNHKRWDNYRLIVKQIRKEFKDEEEFKKYLNEACAKINTILKNEAFSCNKKFTLKEVFGPGKVQMNDRSKLKGINKPIDWYSKKSIKPTEKYTVNNHKVEYFADTNQYFVDDIEVASISAIVEYISDINEYEEVPYRDYIEGKNLRQIHPYTYGSIKEFEESKKRCNTYEFKNYLKIKKQEDLTYIESEKIVLFCNENDIPLFCGQIDFAFEKKKRIGLIDIQRTNEINFDKTKLKLNLLRLAYMQSYNTDIDFIDVIRFNMKEYEYQKIDIDETYAKKIISDLLIEK